MSYPIGIPESVRVGNTSEWCLRAYDISGNELTYAGGYTAYWVLSNSSNQMSASTTTENDQGYLFSVNTSGWVSGEYTSVVYVDNGTKRYEQNVRTVLVNPSLATAVDSRTSAKKILDAIDAAILGSATDNQLAMSIAGRSIQRMSLEELIKAKSQFESIVASEQANQDMKDGKLSNRTINTRLRRG